MDVRNKECGGGYRKIGGAEGRAQGEGREKGKYAERKKESGAESRTLY